MNKIILVLDSDEKQCRELCGTLEKRQYETMPVYSLADLERHVDSVDAIAVILDIDTVALDNRKIKELTQKNPGVYFLCLSRDRFHPDLKESICYHIHACINKPVDPDELFFWIRSIYENEAETKNSKKS